MKIGLLIIATNKYTQFLSNLIKSADEYFLKNHEVTYFIFTNQNLNIETQRNIQKTYVEHREWPWMTLGRYHIFSKNRELFQNMDYLYYCDVDMLFVDEIEDVILGDRVATIHPGYIGRRGTPETNPKSLACVHSNEDMQYFCGGFNGGSMIEYLKMSEQIAHNIDIDLTNNIIAIWHDESHINRYFIDNKPTKILDSSYCYPEQVCDLYYHDVKLPKRLLALQKQNLSEYR